MKIYFSISEKGFFREGFNGNMPGDLVEISQSEYETLLEGQASGQQIVVENGKPTLAVVQVALEDVKANKLNEINRAAQAFVAQVAKLDETPDFEQATWQAQAEEAVAWFKDNSTPTPKLDLLASLRGIPPEVLRQKAYDKAQAFYQLSFMVAGQRQAFEDKLKQAETVEDVKAIEPIFTLEVANG